MAVTRLMLGACGFAAAAAGPSAMAQTYRPVDLGSLGGPSAAYAVNASGAAAGNAPLPPSLLFRAARFGAGASPANLGAGAGFVHSVGLSINSAGDVFGVSYNLGAVPGQSAGFRAAANSPGLLLSLGAFEPRGANDAGVVVGAMTVTDALGVNPHACSYANGTLTDLGTLGGEFSEAMAVSPSGRVVGLAATAGNAAVHACLWQNGAAIDLGTLGGAKSGAWAVNDRGQVLGFAQTAGGLAHACVWNIDASGAVVLRTDLGDLGPAGRGYSYGRGLNSRGQAVGASNAVAFFSAAGVAGIAQPQAMVDLNSRIVPGSGWSITAAWAINDSGEIAGVGVFNGWPRAVLLRPCPGDTNGDFRADFADLNLTLSGFGQSVPAGTGGDANNDGVVDFSDLNIVLSAFGTGC